MSEYKLYPQLPIDTGQQVAQIPTAPDPLDVLVPAPDAGHAYRLQKISEIQKEITSERDKRMQLSKKYHRSVKIINIFDNVLVASTLGLSIAGIGLLTTIIAAPIAIAMEAASLVTGAISIIGNQVNRKLELKAEKHMQIRTLAEAKLNTISDHISKALQDDKISDEEYSLILSEVEKFNEMKEQIQSKIKIGIDEQTKQSLINQGREEATKTFENMFQKKKLTAKAT